MKNLLLSHFNVQKGMYFDRHIVDQNCDFFFSDIITDSYWNYAFVSDPSMFKKGIPSYEEIFQSANRLPCFYVTNQIDPANINFMFRERHYSLQSEESFMVFEGSYIFKAPSNDIAIQRAKGKAAFDDFIDVFLKAYGGERTIENPYGGLDVSYVNALTRSFNNYNQFYHFICYYKGLPVSIASLCFVSNYAGLYNVGTDPNFRGKGYGTMVTQACIDMATKLGVSLLFLQTEKGSPVEKWYETLDFQTAFVGKTYVLGD